MDGEISLDHSFDSGVPGCPGSRFVINLKSPRIEHPPTHHHEHHPHDKDNDGREQSIITQSYAIAPDPGVKCDATSSSGSRSQTCTTESDNATDLTRKKLPEACSVLLVDDNAIIRKMLARAIRNVAPKWKFREAASGETALRLVEEADDKINPFDIIFVDQYMASVEKQLLGTETVLEMRHRGIQSIVCGLSANDKEFEFLQAGANAFLLKPFPCDQQVLTRELLRILHCNDSPESSPHNQDDTWAYAR